MLEGGNFSWELPQMKAPLASSSPILINPKLRSLPVGPDGIAGD